MAGQVRFQLVCRQDPEELGIEWPDGSWNMDKFREHVQECQVCQEFAAGLLAQMRKSLKGED